MSDLPCAVCGHRLNDHHEGGFCFHCGSENRHTYRATHAPVVGAFTMSGTPACVCGYRHRSRHGSKARAKLRTHLAKHHAT